MSFHTHITIADRGWILEKLAKEIAICSDNVSYGTEPNPTADLHYYINYSCRHRRVGPVEIAFFTHSEREESARKRYFDIAADVEHSVCMSKRYADELKKAGIKDVTTITPGVDLDVFTPKVRIGVVGRTYHTGRKGESLIADVMDIPGIEWRFTGQGWPGQSTFIEDAKMPDFYNDLDYVLIPALYEGGPMSVLEGLACGVPIIASNVGWVNEYPHIPFENGKSESLRKVLTSLVDERLKLRESVAHRTWRAWGESHLQMFEKVAKKHKIGTRRKSAAKSSLENAEKLTALLVTHGGEGKTLGGPSVRVPKTAEELGRIGIASSLPHEASLKTELTDIAHVFNLWPLESAYKCLSDAKRAGRRTVFSPIFLNLTHHSRYSQSVPRLIKDNIKSPGALKTGLAAMQADIVSADKRPPIEPFPGYADKLSACLDMSDHLIFLSDYEQRCVDELVGIRGPSSIVRNPVDASRFNGADPDLFRKTYKLDDYILCVGRIEARKNQLMLAYAARDLDVPVVFVGHDGNSGYADLVRSIAPENAIFVPRIEPTDPLLASAFTGASAFCLPSWAEGAPLAALEACAAGVPLVLSDRSSEPKYFGDLAQYVNPVDVDGLCEALNTAVAQQSDTDLRQKRIDLATSEYNWDKHAKATAKVYRKTLSEPANAVSLPDAIVLPPTENTKIYIDLTTSWHHSGHPTGIARVEEKCLQSLLNVYGDRVVPIVWNSKTATFLRLSIADALASSDTDALTRFEDSGQATPLLGETIPEPGRILVFGGAWIRNANYIGHIRRLKSKAHLNVTLLVHDLIQLVAGHLYPPSVAAEFVKHVGDMITCADSFLTYSDTTIKDLSAYLDSHGEYFKPIHKFRLGDIRSIEAVDDEENGDPPSELCESLDGENFVIYVSSLDLRKNHILLINVWRRLIEQRGAKVPMMLFIGRSMWGGDKIMEMVEGEAKLAKKVKFLQNVNDKELHWLYENCSFTAYPSLHEGWGLPVAESLAIGKVCLASNSTSTREIAPALTELLDPYDFKSWVEKVGYFLDHPEALKSREVQIEAEFTFSEWDDTVAEIVSAVDILPLSRWQQPMIWPGNVIQFTDNATEPTLAEDLCRSNWARRERNGRWSLGKRANLCFQTRVANSDKLFLRMKLHALADPELQLREAKLSINGQFAGTYLISDKSSYIDIELEGSSLSNATGDHQQFDIWIDMAEELSVSMINGSKDTRSLGVYLGSIVVSSDKKMLERGISASGLLKVRTKEEHEARQALIATPQTRSSVDAGTERALQQALLILDSPGSLPQTNPLFKALTFVKADTAVLFVYRKLTGRTHDALRRIITALVSDEK